MLASQNIVIILCGNKKDLDADREVTFLEASRFAQENGTSSSNSLYIFFLQVHFAPTFKLTGLQADNLILVNSGMNRLND